MAATADRRRFTSARPFPHLVIDDFLSLPFARALTAEFPPYDSARFRDPFGREGKASYRRFAALGPAFRRLDALTLGRSFRRRLEALSGIRGLLHDRDRYRGGAHEYLNGMGLPPHLDFNALGPGWNRRLNVMIFLTPGWRPGWGGEVVLGSRARGQTEKAIAPLFNRCLLFAVDDRSWYRVRPPAAPRRTPAATRKSASLYYYAAEPPERASAPRLTLWDFPGLPRRAEAGARLDESLWRELETPLMLRDRELLPDAPLGGGRLPSPLSARLVRGASLTRRDVDWLSNEFARRDRALKRRWHYSERFLDEAVSRLRSGRRRYRRAP
ncbi:MAG TPA: 2OG-Fe(II) oxygenase [Elusimicrobiota bacterium]|nr:2OG-Fe(II) oxygenase [Elusimicrobiota bacterium]